MQDKTINNALVTLAKAGGTEGRLAEVLLDMRGVSWSGITQDRPLKRGETKRIVMNALRDGLTTTSEIAKHVRLSRPDITQTAASNRVYQALLRLEQRGLVVRDGRVWGLA